MSEFTLDLAWETSKAEMDQARKDLFEEPAERDESKMVAPRWLDPLVDLNTPTRIYRWYKLVHEWGDDLLFESCAVEALGKLPAWVEHNDETDIEDMIGVDWCPQRILHWGLENGLAPGQPFLICIDEPRWYKSGGYEYEEWDCEWDAEIVRVMPRDPRSAARSWARIMEVGRRHREDMERRKQATYQLQMRCLKDLHISATHFFTERYYDDMAFPTGLRLTLYSKRQLHGVNGHTPLASGESRKGEHQEAFDDLVTSTLKHHPDLIPLDVMQAYRRSFPMGSVALSRWATIASDREWAKGGPDHAEVRPVE